MFLAERKTNSKDSAIAMTIVRNTAVQLNFADGVHMLGNVKIEVQNKIPMQFQQCTGGQLPVNKCNLCKNVELDCTKLKERLGYQKYDPKYFLKVCENCFHQLKMKKINIQ